MFVLHRRYFVERWFGASALWLKHMRCHNRLLFELRVLSLQFSTAVIFGSYIVPLPFRKGQLQ
jgi:hypothetical protein